MCVLARLIAVLIFCCIFAGIPAKAEESRFPIVIAHRGASGYRPEHTLAAYELAIEMGADFVEPDLVSTKDGVLVARHENEISGSTDVADHPEFRRRRVRKIIDGVSLYGWFTEDFTLAELKTLRAVERLPLLRQRNTIYNGIYEVPTFAEIIDLVKRKSAELKKSTGIYIEVKHPSYFASIGLPLEKNLIDSLRAAGLEAPGSPIYIQCFEPSALKRMHELTKLPLIQLLEETGRPYDFAAASDSRDFAWLCSPNGLAETAKYAAGIGPSKNLLIPRDRAAKLTKASDLLSEAHRCGLKVHPWTFRNENAFLPRDFLRGDEASAGFKSNYGDALSEYKRFYELGVDGVFSENPDTAVEARGAFLRRCPQSQDIPCFAK